jgi:hypothetical protein
MSKAMKRSIPALLLACLAMIPSCVVTSPPPVPYIGQYSGALETAYRRGYELGFLDGRRGRDENYERYHYEYGEASEDAFERGYDLGYEAGEDQSEADDASRDRAKNEGYNAGRSDAENGLSPFYQRHRSLYTQETEADFRNGYVRGYNAGRSDDAPVGSRRAYDGGYRQGELDAERGRPARPESFLDNIDEDDEAAYMRGYRDGYRHELPRY